MASADQITLAEAIERLSFGPNPPHAYALRHAEDCAISTDPCSCAPHILIWTRNGDIYRLDPAEGRPGHWTLHPTAEQPSLLLDLPLG